jgi:hypothetical protein
LAIHITDRPVKETILSTHYQCIEFNPTNSTTSTPVSLIFSSTSLTSIGKDVRSLK